MAGIGFALERLYRSDAITERVASFAHASVVAAGPCLLSVLCIWLISAFNSEVEGQHTVAVFRAVVIYCIALSFVVTAPIALVSARLVSDKLHDRKVGAVPGIVLIALAAAAPIVAAGAAILFGMTLGLHAAAAIAATATCTLLALVWIACLFCSVTRDYNAVTAFFGAGMLSAFVAVTLIYGLWPTLQGMLWGFSAGLSLTLFGLIARIIGTFPFAFGSAAGTLRMLGRATLAYWPIALGGLLGAAGAWIDKWIVWLSPQGKIIQFGLLHAPLYDSAMFVAYLVVLPAYAAFVVHLDVSFFRNYRMFYAGILGHATLGQICDYGGELRRKTMASLTGIMLPQFVICGLVALLAPGIVELLDMQYRQVGVLRLGVIGALFQFLFVTCSSLVLYFDRRIVFLLLQACFFTLNATLTTLSLWLGPQYLGLGFLWATAGAAAIAYLALAETLGRIEYLTFIGNNPAVRIRTASAG